MSVGRMLVLDGRSFVPQVFDIYQLFDPADSNGKEHRTHSHTEERSEVKITSFLSTEQFS